MQNLFHIIFLGIRFVSICLLLYYMVGCVSFRYQNEVQNLEDMLNEIIIDAKHTKEIHNQNEGIKYAQSLDNNLQKAHLIRNNIETLTNKKIGAELENMFYLANVLVLEYHACFDLNDLSQIENKLKKAKKILDKKIQNKTEHKTLKSTLSRQINIIKKLNKLDNLITRNETKSKLWIGHKKWGKNKYPEAFNVAQDLLDLKKYRIQLKKELSKWGESCPNLYTTNILMKRNPVWLDKNESIAREWINNKQNCTKNYQHMLRITDHIQPKTDFNKTIDMYCRKYSFINTSKQKIIKNISCPALKDQINLKSLATMHFDKWNILTQQLSNRLPKSLEKCNSIDIKNFGKLSSKSSECKYAFNQMKKNWKKFLKLKKDSVQLSEQNFNVIEESIRQLQSSFNKCECMNNMIKNHIQRNELKKQLIDDNPDIINDALQKIDGLINAPLTSCLTPQRSREGDLTEKVLIYARDHHIKRAEKSLKQNEPYKDARTAIELAQKIVKALPEDKGSLGKDRLKKIRCRSNKYRHDTNVKAMAKKLQNNELLKVTEALDEWSYINKEINYLCDSDKKNASQRLQRVLNEAVKSHIDRCKESLRQSEAVSCYKIANKFRKFPEITRKNIDQLNKLKEMIDVIIERKITIIVTKKIPKAVIKLLLEKDKNILLTIESVGTGVLEIYVEKQSGVKLIQLDHVKLYKQKIPIFYEGKKMEVWSPDPQGLVDGTTRFRLDLTANKKITVSVRFIIKD